MRYVVTLLTAGALVACAGYPSARAAYERNAGAQHRADAAVADAARGLHLPGGIPQRLVSDYCTTRAATSIGTSDSVDCTASLELIWDRTTAGGESLWSAELRDLTSLSGQLNAAGWSMEGGGAHQLAQAMSDPAYDPFPVVLSTHAKAPLGAALDLADGTTHRQAWGALSRRVPAGSPNHYTLAVTITDVYVASAECNDCFLDQPHVWPPSPTA